MVVSFLIIGVGLFVGSNCKGFFGVSTGVGVGVGVRRGCALCLTLEWCVTGFFGGSSFNVYPAQPIQQQVQ